MSSTYPDWQGIQQWFGDSIFGLTAEAIGLNLRSDGPLTLTSWASIVLWAKATNAAVTFTITQGVADGSAALTRVQTITVPAGGTIIQAIVLVGDSITITRQGAAANAIIDYAVVPSNTTTTTALATLATLTGRVSSAGVIQQGSGFSVVRAGVGNYQVTFSQSYAASPVVIVQTEEAAATPTVAILAGIGVSSFNLLIFNSTLGLGTPVDQQFAFLVTPMA